MLKHRDMRLLRFLAGEEGVLTDLAEADVYIRYPVSSCREPCTQPPSLIKAPLTFGKQSQLEAVKQDEASQTFSKYL